MNWSEAKAALIGAKPLISRIRYTPFNWNTNNKECVAFTNIEQLLQEFSYSKELLEEAGWTRVDLFYLRGRLNYYRTHL